MTDATLSKIARVLFIAAFVCALIAAGQSDYEDEQREQARYCQNVREGTWPDYRGDYEETCRVPD